MKERRSPQRPVMPSVQAELAQLGKAPIAQLRNRWRGLFRSDPPKAFGPDLLRLSIAGRIQERAYGGLSKQTQSELDRFIKQSGAKPNGPLDLTRQIKPGTEVVRTWKGKSHRVVVLRDGFRYGTKIYPSLSEIATHIAGSRWNGPRFFGLRSAAAEANTNGK